MTYNSISELESRLQYLSKSALEQVARYVGVSRFYAMNMEQLRAAILAISQGEVAPLPIYQRHIPSPKPNRNEDLVDAVLAFSEANLKPSDMSVIDDEEWCYNSVADIDEGLSDLTKFALDTISRNVGIARSYALNKEQLRVAILAIAKGEVAPLPIKKRLTVNSLTVRNQAIIDAVLSMYELNSK